MAGRRGAVLLQTARAGPALKDPGPKNAFFDEDDESDRKEEIPQRTYEWMNLSELSMPHLHEPPPDEMEDGSSPPTMLPYFTKVMHYQSTSVLEDAFMSDDGMRQCNFLRPLNAKFVAAMVKVPTATRQVIYLPEQVIARQGEPADSLVIVVKGKVDLLKDGSVVGQLGPGDSLGEREFFGATNVRSVSAVAVSFCDVHLLYQEALKRTLATVEGMGEELKDLLSLWHEDEVPMGAVVRFSRRWAKKLEPPDIPAGDPIQRSRRCLRGVIWRQRHSALEAPYVNKARSQLASTGSQIVT